MNKWSQLRVLVWVAPKDERNDVIAVALVRDSLAPAAEQGGLLAEARQLREVVGKISALRLDHTEFTCLKAIMLFKPGKYSAPWKSPTKKFLIWKVAFDGPVTANHRHWMQDASVLTGT